MISNQYNKKCVIYYRKFKLVWNFRKILIVLEFEQWQWLNPDNHWNEYATNGANNGFKKDFFELMSFSISEKFTKNLRDTSKYKTYR